jgi:predicted TIM-barrel fold metal-dependent hydrolase
MTIIDFRLRPPFGAYLQMAVYADAERRDRITRIHGFEPAESALAKSLPKLIEEMDDAGVTMGVVIGRCSGRLGSIDNSEILEFVREHPKRFIGVASVDPTSRRAACDQISQAVKNGFRAINIEPGSYPLPMLVDDRRLYPIYAQCEDLDIPVIIMTGGSAGPDLSYTMPVHFDRVAADFPQLKLVVSHGGWPWVHEMIHIAFRRPNVYLSPDQYLAQLPGSDDYVRAADGFLADRFLYGSSYPFTPVKGYADWFRKLPIRPESMEKVLYRNAAKLLRIDLNEIGIHG